MQLDTEPEALYGNDQTATQARRRMIGREVLQEEEASPNYRLRQVQRRRTGEVSWEVVDASSGVSVATGLSTREEGLRIVRGWERLSQRLEGGLAGHVLVH
jgi:hypothetical protein